MSASPSVTEAAIMKVITRSSVGVGSSTGFVTASSDGGCSSSGDTDGCGTGDRGGARSVLPGDPPDRVEKMWALSRWVPPRPQGHLGSRRHPSHPESHRRCKLFIPGGCPVMATDCSQTVVNC